MKLQLSLLILSFSQQAQATTSGCVVCPQVVPRCPNDCTPDSVCRISPQTCNSCSSATCIPVSNCVRCLHVEPRCPPCTADSVCRKLPQTCNSCPSAICQPKKIGKLGESCGGEVLPENEVYCGPGLTCVDQPQEGPVFIADLPGVCVAITTSTVKPTQTTSTVKPTQTTSTVKPTQTTSTVKPTQTTSTVKPTQTSSVVYPTDVVVGAASGITAFSFAGMIALFL